MEERKGGRPCRSDRWFVINLTTAGCKKREGGGRPWEVVPIRGNVCNSFCNEHNGREEEEEVL